jgi:CHAT domain-containing protein
MAQAVVWLRRASRSLDEAAADIAVDDLLAGFLGGEWHLYYDLLVEALAREGRWEEAFVEAERARARALLASLSGQRLRPTGAADPDLIAQANGLRAALADWERELAGAAGPERLRLQGDLDRGRAEYSRLLTRIKVASPEVAALSRAETVETAAVQASLAADTALVSYYFTPHGAVAWVVDRERIHGYRLDFGAPEAHLVRCFASSLETPSAGDQRGVRLLEGCSGAEGAGERLYARLIAPLTGAVGGRRLVIAPHGVLHGLPFAALRDPASGRYLIEDHVLATVPSASVLPLLRAKETAIAGRALVLGDPAAADPSLGPLVHGNREAWEVAELLGVEPLLGPAASESALFERAGASDLLHIAAHGVFDPRSPRFSRLHLAPGAGRDGNLEVHEVYAELDLTAADLVVLSSCETALGERSRGDEIVGLTRAFLYAGSPGVIATLWRIDDRAAADLMGEFYRQLLGGERVAEALRAAQLAALRNPAFHHPSHWAAFLLVGDPQGRLPPP